MSLDMDSRKNRSSSTTEISTFFIKPPVVISLDPSCGQRTMRTRRMELFRMYKNATSAMPMPHKLWLMSKRHEPSYRMPDVDLYSVEPVVKRVGRRRAVSVCVNFGVPRASSMEKKGCPGSRIGTRNARSGQACNQDTGR